MKRYKVEFLDSTSLRPRNKEPLWFDSKLDMVRFLDLLRGCPISDGPTRLQCTTYEITHIETVVIP